MFLLKREEAGTKGRRHVWVGLFM